MSNQAALFADHLLKEALEKNVSDIHFHPSVDQENVSIFYRELGKRKFIRNISQSFYQIMLAYFKFTANMDIGETRQPQNGMIRWSMKQTEYHLRLSTLPLGLSESLTIRVFPQSKTPKLKELFLFYFQYKQLKRWLYKHSGIILLTGPTGSGKSTTMYSMLEELVCNRSMQAITLEEPVERHVHNVLQVEINRKAGMTYEKGLKAALRHDPDTILLGEIRDETTATFALRAALTGHLVLTTLHAKDALGTIERLLDLGITRVDLKQSLIGIASLRLIPVISKGNIERRAAIVELLDDALLQMAITKGEVDASEFQSFMYLKGKAYRYGFICKETYEEAT